MENPTISLGGKQWPVPPLAVKQNRIIDPLIIGVIPVFSDWSSNKVAALSKVDSKTYEALLTIAFTAIQTGAPNLTRSAFEELHITLPELISAFPVIAQQTGLFERGEPQPGEAQATPDSSQTGMQ